MIDLTDSHTLQTLQTALHRALNSLDNEITAVSVNSFLTPSQQTFKLALLHKSRDDMVDLYADLMVK